MATVDTGHKDAGKDAKTQQIVAGKKSQNKGDQEGEQTEFQSVTPIMLHTAHVQLQSCQEHDVVDTHLTEKLEGAVPVQDVKAVLAHQHTSQNQADDVGNAQAA